MTPHPLTFTQEQAVQHTIALIQKRYHVSSLLINEPIIRQAVQRGKSPSQIVIEMFRPVKES